MKTEVYLRLWQKLWGLEILHSSVRATIDYDVIVDMVKHDDIQSIFGDYRHATTASLGICSCFRHHMQRPTSCLPLNYSLIHKPRNLSDFCEFKCAWDELRPFSVQVIINISTVRWEFWLLNSMQYPVNDTIRFPAGNEMMNKESSCQWFKTR